MRLFLFILGIWVVFAVGAVAGYRAAPHQAEGAPAARVVDGPQTFRLGSCVIPIRCVEYD